MEGHEGRLSTAELAGREERQEPASPDESGDEPVARERLDAPEAGHERRALFPEDAVGELRGRWERIQTGFVDEPRRAVEEADALVADLMRRLAESFADERESLEAQWDRGDEISTEDLRVALQRYRSFFDRLLSV